MRICSSYIYSPQSSKRIQGTYFHHPPWMQSRLRPTHFSLAYLTNTLFGHTTMTTRTCSHCGSETKRDTFHEQDLILQVAWDQETSLTQILNNGDLNNVYEDLRCEKCKANRRHPYQKRFWLVPDILIIHLKRFEPTDDFSDYKKKIVCALTMQDQDVSGLTTASQSPC